MSKARGFNFRKVAAVMRPDVLAAMPPWDDSQRTLFDNDDLRFGSGAYPVQGHERAGMASVGIGAARLVRRRRAAR